MEYFFIEENGGWWLSNGLAQVFSTFGGMNSHDPIFIAPPPTEIAREIYQLKKQSEFMSKEILIVTINGDREDHGIRFIFPGKNGYRSASKPTFFSAVLRCSPKTGQLDKV